MLLVVYIKFWSSCPITESLLSADLNIAFSYIRGEESLSIKSSWLNVLPFRCIIIWVRRCETEGFIMFYQPNLNVTKTPHTTAVIKIQVIKKVIFHSTPVYEWQCFIAKLSQLSHSYSLTVKLKTRRSEPHVFWCSLIRFALCSV